MNVFKVLDLKYRKSCLELSRVKIGTADYYVVKKRQEVLGSVLGVLNSYSWVKREEVKKKLKYFIENGYDYDALAEEFNISKKSAYVLISRASRQFQEVLEVNSVDELLEDNFDIDNIKINDDSILNIFISDIREQFAVRESKDVDLKECMLELTTLKNLTKKVINNRLKKLDVDKIAHILYILQSDDIKHTLEKKLVEAYLEGNIKSKEELEVKIKELCK